MEIKRGDIFYANIPSNNEEIRPYLVIQNDLINFYAPTTIVVPLSSNTHRLLPIHVLLQSEKTGLPKDSVVLTDKIQTIDKNYLEIKITHLDPNMMETVSDAINMVLGIGILQNQEEDIINYYRFELNEKVNIIEDDEYEFKELKGPSIESMLKDTVAENCVAFLNSHKVGHLLYGVSNERVVKGVKITIDQFDKIKLAIQDKIISVQPSISPDYIKINYHHVYENNIIVSDLYVIEILIPITSDTYDTYYANGNEIYLRLDGKKQKLIGTQISSYFRKRFS